jgi:rhodanese-related sulfurtransferase
VKPIKTKLLIVLAGLIFTVLIFGQGKGELQNKQRDFNLSPAELARIVAQDSGEFILIDVRTTPEYRAGAIPSAINIAYDLLANNLPTGDRAQKIIVYCRSGRRSSIARRTLEELGFDEVYNFGAIGNWQGELLVRE